MTFAGLLQDVVGEDRPYPNVRQLAIALDVHRSKVDTWLAGRIPRGGVQAMLRIAEQVGYTREQALAKIGEPEPEPDPAISVELLEEHLLVPPGEAGRFMELDREDPEAVAAAWRAAGPVFDAMLAARRGQSQSK